jgi:hypothetical protein
MVRSTRAESCRLSSCGMIRCTASPSSASTTTQRSHASGLAFFASSSAAATSFSQRGSKPGSGSGGEPAA